MGVPEGGHGIEHLLGLGDWEASTEAQLGLRLQGRVQGDGDLLGGRSLNTHTHTYTNQVLIKIQAQ